MSRGWAILIDRNGTAHVVFPMAWVHIAEEIPKPAVSSDLLVFPDA